MNLGGSISNSSIFQNILSIGYEFEVPSLSKLIYINNKGNDILVNTDITLGRIADTDFFEEDESEDIDDSEETTDKDEGLILEDIGSELSEEAYDYSTEESSDTNTK